MKRYLYIFLLLLSMGGCARREVIPDGVLANIFHDVMLTNAYKHHFPFDSDSLQVYAPIFEKYGYSAEDVNYTIGNFSKRKSARLSDVVERAISKLEVETRNYKKEVTILDSVDAIALRRALKYVHRNEEMQMRLRSDSANMYIIIEDIIPGEYRIQFDYLIDSIDRNNLSYRTLAWFERDSMISKIGTPQRFKQNSAYLTKRKVTSLDRKLTADSLDDRLVIQMVEWRGNLRFAPHVTMKNIRVTHTPSLEDAVEQLYDRFMNYRLFSPKFYEPYAIAKSTSTAQAQKADSLELHTSGE